MSLFSLRQASLFAVLLAATLCVTAALALDFPALTGRVVDNADLLSSQQESRLTAQLARHEESTSNQVVVATLPSLQGTAIEDFGYQLGRHWGIGQAGRDNGVLLIVAPNERKVRIEVGYGLEGDLPDAIARAIIDNDILPAFRRNDYAGGIQAGVDGIILAIDGAYEPVKRKKKNDAFALMMILIIFAVFVIFAISYFFDGFEWRGPLREKHYSQRNRDNRGGFGGGFGGSGSGGFGGGGGGFGGGGSSGSW